MGGSEKLPVKLGASRLSLLRVRLVLGAEAGWLARGVPDDGGLFRGFVVDRIGCHGTFSMSAHVAERSKARGSGPRLARGVGSNPTVCTVLLLLLLLLFLFRGVFFSFIFFFFS
jgi:hypothetical protein